MIVLKDIYKTYSSEGVETHALRGINLRINQGEYISIVGKSWCGKSTLLNILGGMDRESSGSYRFLGQDVSTFNEFELAVFRNRILGYIFQGFHLIPELSLLDNVALPLGYAGMKSKERKQKAFTMLKKVGLEEEHSKRPPQLSGGQQQRVAIARALVHEPKLILADEPTGNLDEETGLEIIELLEANHVEGRTLIMVTHDLDLASRAQRSLTMADGKNPSLKLNHFMQIV